MIDFLTGIIDWINGGIGLYAISLLIFTLVFRSLVLPLDVKSRKGMRKMSKVQPKLQEIQKKYANDQVKMQKKQQELMKKEGVSMLSGCLPMLLQYPILLIMFYAMRSVANREMARQVLEAIGSNPYPINASDSFLWIKNIWVADSFFSSIAPAGNQLGMIPKESWTAAISNLNPEQLIALYNGISQYSVNLITPAEWAKAFAALDLDAAQVQSVLTNLNLSTANIQATLSAMNLTGDQIRQLVDALGIAPADMAAILANLNITDLAQVENVTSLFSQIAALDHAPDVNAWFAAFQQIAPADVLDTVSASAAQWQSAYAALDAAQQQIVLAKAGIVNLSQLNPAAYATVAEAQDALKAMGVNLLDFNAEFNTTLQTVAGAYQKSDFYLTYAVSNANQVVSNTWLGNVYWPSNGYMILAVLSLVSQLAMTKINPAADPAAQQQQNSSAASTGKFMKYFFPLLSFYFCVSSYAAFALYWVFSNVYMIGSTLVINKIIDKQEKEQGTATINGEGSIK